MSSKIDPSPIIKAHLTTLRLYGFAGRTSKADMATFFGFPITLGALLLWIKFGYRQDAVNGFLSAFAVLTGLMLNLLVLVFTLASASSSALQGNTLRAALLKEIFANVCFSILASLGVVAVSVVALSYMKSQEGAITGPIATFLLTALTANFLLTLLMLVKRMFIVLNKELTPRSGKDRAA